MAELLLGERERINRINDDIVLIESEDGLKFTTDAYLLSAYIKRPKGENIRAAELGAGTGVISLLLAARARADRISAFEVQEKFYGIMCRNIENNGLSDRIVPVHADIRDVNEQNAGGQFDIVFSNPPYMRLDAGRGNASGEKNIARREVMGGISDFCRAAARLCKFGGVFYVVYRPERTAELFYALSESGFEPKTLTYIHPDEKSQPSTLLCAAKRGGRAGGLCVTPPLFMYKNGTREETDTVKKIYEDGKFPEYYI